MTGAAIRRIGALATFAVALSAWSLSAAQIVVIEAHVGERRERDARVLATIRRAIEQSPRVIPTVEVASRFEAGRSRAGASRDAGIDLQNRLRDLVDAGNDAWMNAAFERASTIFERAVQISRSAPSEAAGRISWKPLVQRSMVGVALSAKRRGDDRAAEDAMAEFIRTYPDDPVDRPTFGPEAWKLYETARKTLASQPTGRLWIAVDDPDAVVFLNERYVGVGSTELDELPPGRYRVHVRKGAAPGRIYEIEVTSGHRAKLEVAWSFDAALVTGPGVIGFVFPDEATRARLLPSYAARLARATRAQELVVLEMSADERGIVSGSAFSIDSTLAIRAASLATRPGEPSGEQLASLGSYLAGETTALPAGALAATAPSTRARGRRRPLLWTAAIVGAAGAAGGAYLLALDDRETWKYGLALTIAGGVTLASSTYFLARRRGTRAPVVSASSDRVVLGLMGRF